MTQRLLHNPGREQITEAIKAALDSYPNRSELARRLGVSRKQTYEWEAGNNVPGLEVLASLAELTGTPIVLAFGPVADTEETPPPKWARALADQAAEDAITRLVPERLVRRLPEFLDRLEGFLQQADEDAHGGSGSQDPDGSAQQGRTAV